MAGWSRPRATGSTRGQALVEFALILPIFILVLVGIFDLGRAVIATSTLNNAAHEGARLAIVDQTLADVQARAAQRADWLRINPAAVKVDYRNPATPETANSCVQPGGASAVGSDYIFGCIAVVRIEYQYDAATPIIGTIVGTIQLAGEARFPVEFNCVDDLLAKPPRDCPLGE